jgi:hypothetical protein
MVSNKLSPALIEIADRNLVDETFIAIATALITKQLHPTLTNEQYGFEFESVARVVFYGLSTDALTLHSKNGSVLTTTANGASAAISYVAMNWVIWSLHAKGYLTASQIADSEWRKVGRRFLQNRDNLTQAEKAAVRKFAD